MRRASVRALLALAAAVAAPGGAAQDAARGRELYELHCGGCHYQRVHQRGPERRSVKSRAELRAEVARRAAQAPRRLTIEDLEDIATYLERSHYRFDK